MKKITVIDLNNFSYYPTLAIGYLISYLRKADFEVELLSPLNQGVGARKRERIENITHYWKSLVINSDKPIVKKLMAGAKRVPFIYNRYLKKEDIFDLVIGGIDPNTDLVLISTYFENFYVCKQLGAYLKERNIPLIIGGPGFNNKSVAQEWMKLEGVDVIVGAEIDGFLVNLVNDFFAGRDITKYPGVLTRGQTSSTPSHVFTDMEELPVPDFSDFPWDKYPMSIIPFMTARGCGWGKCNFCTDVTYVNGRTFRSMSKQKVLSQLKELSELNSSNHFYFSDIKLNSNLEVWYGLIDELPDYVKDPKWFATVHVDNKKENGLDRDTIFKAKQAGLSRLSFGFETASQNLLNHMHKGTRIEKIERFLNDVHEAGISLRATMFVGYPYETEEDLKLTYEFLKKNKHCFDRISLSKFQLFEMAPIYDMVKDEFEDKEVTNPKYNHRINMKVNRGAKYSRYKHRVLKQVNEINSQPITKEAIAYDGIM
ncbi:MAG: radical SAM protein [Bacteroidota bacterium]